MTILWIGLGFLAVLAVLLALGLIIACWVGRFDGG